MSKRKMIRIPSLKGVPDGPPGRLIAETALQEIALAISELADGAHVELEPEIGAVEKILRQRAVLRCGPINDDLCRFGAALVIKAMRMQKKLCKRLANGGTL
jgi:hypothetical protein